MTRPDNDAEYKPEGSRESVDDANRYPKKRGRPFSKGNKANIKGGPKLPESYKEMRRVSHVQIAEVGAMILNGSMKEMMAIAKDPDATPLKVMLASVTVRAINKGDHAAMQEVLNRIAGKVKDRVEISGDPDSPVRMAVLKLTPEEMEAAALRRAAMIKAANESE